jgi:hypothetical protein
MPWSRNEINAHSLPDTPALVSICKSLSFGVGSVSNGRSFLAFLLAGDGF